MKVYLVGGAVRDQLLGRPVQDRDWVVVGATGAEMEAQGFRRVGKDFPVFLHPDTHEEYALARTERKTGIGYGGFSFDTSTEVTLEQDLARRDLTINAMAQDETGQIIDPYGGRDDLDKRILRHVGPAFVEDPLRVLRVCRFAARDGFAIAAETMTLLRSIVTSGELKALAAERVWTECRRALADNHPDLFVRAMRECGALAALIPEVDRLFGVPQPIKYHPEIDTGDHVCLALEQAAALDASEEIRFAILLHDVGKGTTPTEELPSHIGHEQRGVPIVDDICDRLKVPKDFRALAKTVTEHHLLVHRVQYLRPAKLLALLESLDALRRPERFGQILLACEIDATGRTGLQSQPYPQRAFLHGAREAAAEVTTDSIKSAGFEGEAFAEVLRQRRIEALTTYIDRHAQV